MKKNIIRIAGLSFTLFLSVLVTGTALAQGKGNAKKDAATTVAEDQETGNDKSRGRAQEAREKNQRANNPGQSGTAAQKREAARTKAGQDQPTGQTGTEDQATKGNAYGKNKGELSGREFGQNRAANARMTGEQRRASLEVAVTNGDKKAKDARTKIARAKTDLERDRKNKKISEARYNEKKAKIEQAETAVKVLEDKVNEGREINAAAQ